MTDAIETEIRAKGLTAPRVTPEGIENKICAEYYTTAAGAVGDRVRVPAHAALELLTLCFLVMENGFTIVGKSACASPENFDADLGRKIARADAFNQIWPLEGYQLKSQLAGRT